MVDVLSPAQRQLNMSRIRGKDTKPELLIRRGLHAAGFRFRLHRRDLPGRPDIVLTGRHAAVFVHGCFWHGHTCPMSKLPATRPEFWANKIKGNRERDGKAIAALCATGWRVLVVWECALRGPARFQPHEAIRQCSAFLRNDRQASLEIAGVWKERLNEI